MEPGSAPNFNLQSALGAVAIGVAFSIPVVFWPWSPFPFSTAKFWLLSGWCLAGLVAAACTGKVRNPLPGGWAAGMALYVAALSLSASFGAEVSFRALMEALLPPLSAIVLLWIAPAQRRLMMAWILSADLVALIAILQFLALDPFRMINLAGSLQGSSRIRIFSTLGNPNFVAAFLVAVLPLTVTMLATKYRGAGLGRLYCWSLGIQIAGIAVTGSRASVLGLAAAAFCLFAGNGKIRRIILIAFSLLAAFLIFMSPARSLENTIAGRAYIWRVIVPHLPGVPLTGYGPGAFPLRFAEWETDHLKRTAGEGAHPFAGLTDHAHNDFLEIWVDAGPVGLTAFLIMIGLITVRSGPSVPAEPEMRIGALAGAGALLAVAMVDFPLHRIAESYLFFNLLAVPWIRGRAESRVPNRL
jgi:putative inorganic carbon (hco3(-)) transporter